MASEIFEWDDAKAAATLRERGLAFDYAATIFDDPGRLQVLDTRRDYGEVRMKSVGKSWDGLLLTLIFTQRGERIRIISARLASKMERRLYDGSQRS